MGRGLNVLVAGREHWRRGSCVIIDASQPHLAWGSMGLAAEPGGLLHIHVRTPGASSLAAVICIIENKVKVFMCPLSL
jgi:hypothetical protein